MAYPNDLVRTKNWGSEILTDADLEAQLDLIINWVMAALNSTTGHAHTAVANKSPKINVADGLTVTSQAQGDVLYASSAAAFARLGAGTKGKCFTTGGAAANPTWEGMTTEGDIEYHDGTSRARLAKGTAGQIIQMNTGATAPEWVAGGRMVQVVNVMSSAVATGNTTMPFDDTIPQKTEGVEWMTLAITPTSATNKLLIEVIANFSWATSVAGFSAALFQDATAGALAAVPMENIYAVDRPFQVILKHYMVTGTTSATTFKFRAGPHTASVVTFNGVSAGRLYGGVMASSITITEIKV